MSKLTIGDLKKAIADLPEDMVVMVNGYEDGVQSPCKIAVKSVYYVGQSPYAGDHEIVDSHENVKNSFKVLHIG